MANGRWGLASGSCLPRGLLLKVEARTHRVDRVDRVEQSIGLLTRDRAEVRNVVEEVEQHVVANVPTRTGLKDRKRFTCSTCCKSVQLTELKFVGVAFRHRMPAAVSLFP